MRGDALAAAGPSHQQDVAMRYVGRTALLLKGPASRRVYALTPGRPSVHIDPRDVEAFAASRLFDNV